MCRLTTYMRCRHVLLGVYPLIHGVAPGGETCASARNRVGHQRWRPKIVAVPAATMAEEL